MIGQAPLSRRYEEARKVGAWETAGGAALVMLGMILIIIGIPRLLGKDSPAEQGLIAIGLIILPLGLGIFSIGALRRREELRRVLFVEAPTRGLRIETLAYVQANSGLGVGDITRPEPAPLDGKDLSSLAAKMQTLRSLLEKGLITEEDFQQKKNEILSRL